jgi:hypothetical protein
VIEHADLSAKRPRIHMGKIHGSENLSKLVRCLILEDAKMVYLRSSDEVSHTGVHMSKVSTLAV